MFLNIFLGIFIHLSVTQQIFEDILCARDCWMLGHISPIIYFKFFKIYDLVAKVTNYIYAQSI